MKRNVLASLVSLGSAMSLTLMLASSVFAECPVPWYQTDVNDLIQVKGTLYDNAGNQTKVQCTFATPFGAYGALTGGFSTPPSRDFQGMFFNCPALDWEISYPGPSGADVQIVKNGVPTNACSFVGARDSGSGYPYGWYMSSVLKFDPGTGFKSEKGTLTYNLPSGSFIGKFMVVRK